MRYLVVDTGIWLPGRQVLLSPHALSGAHLAGKTVRLNLTRKQIEDSPAIEWYQPVSRQFEEAYYRYYGWPSYWQDDGLWGMSRFPFSKRTTKPRLNRRAATLVPSPKPAAARLRSTREAKGYHLQASDGRSGHVSDFLVDAKSWAIRQLVIQTGQRASDREMRIPINKVDGIRYDGIREFYR